MRGRRASISGAETAVGIIILTGLLLLAAGLYRLQSRPAAWLGDASLPKADAAPAAESASNRLAACCPEGFIPMGPPEQFDKDTLSDKIDGQADLYTASGFVGLQCQRFANSTAPGSWFELFLYDMGSSRSTFAVFSQQRRPGLKPLAPGRLAYESENSLFLAQGRYYAEFVGSEATPSMLAALESGARQCARLFPETEAALPPELSAFPTNDLVPDSAVLQRVDGLGCADLKDVFLATYRPAAQAPVTAFLIRQSSPAEAARLKATYRKFLLGCGGVEAPAVPALPGAAVIANAGACEIIFDNHDFLAGVHAATDTDAAVAVARRLYDHLGGMQP